MAEYCHHFFRLLVSPTFRGFEGGEVEGRQLDRAKWPFQLCSTRHPGHRRCLRKPLPLEPAQPARKGEFPRRCGIRRHLARQQAACRPLPPAIPAVPVFQGRTPPRCRFWEPKSDGGGGAAAISWLKLPTTRGIQDFLQMQNTLNLSLP